MVPRLDRHVRRRLAAGRLEPNAAPRLGVELVNERLYSATEAQLFLEGFNGSMLAHDEPLWAVAVPITIRYEGDARRGQMITGYTFDDGGGEEKSENDANERLRNERNGHAAPHRDHPNDRTVGCRQAQRRHTISSWCKWCVTDAPYFLFDGGRPRSSKLPGATAGLPSSAALALTVTRPDNCPLCPLTGVHDAWRRRRLIKQRTINV